MVSSITFRLIRIFVSLLILLVCKYAFLHLRHVSLSFLLQNLVLGGLGCIYLCILRCVALTLIRFFNLFFRHIVSLELPSDFVHGFRSNRRSGGTSPSALVYNSSCHDGTPILRRLVFEDIFSGLIHVHALYSWNLLPFALSRRFRCILIELNILFFTTQ